jgi:hypothetical protein
MLFHVQLTGAIGPEFFGLRNGLIDKFYLRRLRDYVEDSIEGKFGVRARLSFSDKFELISICQTLPVPIEQVKRYLIGIVEDYVVRHPVSHT